MKREAKLAELGITLPEKTLVAANYHPFKISGNMVYVSGQGPVVDGQVYYPGKVGRDVDRQEAYEAARITGINILAVLRNALGDLDRIVQMVSVKGYVNSAEDFFEQPYVINGASDLFEQVFEENGAHARCALSVGPLPLNTCVEIECIAEFE